jgi:iron only hydrogenase large subunit-like protein
MAGLTAPRQNPFAKLKFIGISNINMDRAATAMASANYGTKLNKNTSNPFPLNSSSRPALIKIIDRQTYLT